MDSENVTAFKWESMRKAFANAAKNGWDAFRFQVLMRETVIRENPLPQTAITRDKIHSPDDAVSKCLFPNDTEIKQRIAPVKVVGDGNCFFRSISNSVFGTENHHVECRVRCVYELLKNYMKYTSSDTYVEMSSKLSEFQYIFETSISDDARVPNNIQKSLKNEIMNSAKDGQYSSLLHMYASANAFSRPVVTIFPQVQNVAINRQVHNQTIRPVGFLGDKSEFGPPLYIMWTHTSNLQVEMWQPNHFVSCHMIDDTKQSSKKVSSEQPPLKKQKISDFFKCESHDNQTLTTESESHDRTDDQAEHPHVSNPETADEHDESESHDRTDDQAEHPHVSNPETADEHDESESHDRTDDQAEHPHVSNPDTACKHDDTGADQFRRSSKYDLGDILNGTVPLSSLSQTDKISYVESSPDPETLKNLPFKTRLVAGKTKEKKLYFQTSWLENHKWLAYSSVLNGGLCRLCVLFPQSDIRCYDSFVKKPFTNFKKATGKNGSLLIHQNSEYHKNACISYQTLTASLKSPESTVQYKISAQNKHVYDTNLKLLTMIVESIILCGKQNLPFRGHRDDSTSTSSNKGNFRAILNLLANYDKELAQHLEHTPKNATYTSKTIQNQLICIIGQYIRKQILEGLKGKGFYSIIADEVTDKFANQEVLALCLRFIDESQSEPCIREEFFDFVHLERTTGEMISRKIIEVLTQNDLPVEKIRGQAYDGAAAMASEKKGCQARIKEMNKLAVYTHCKNHVLNLSIAHACKLPVVRNMIDGINSTFIFFDASPKRQRYFERVLVHHGTESKRKKLLGLCKTRWVERHTCYDVFYDMYAVVIDCLQYMIDPSMDENTEDDWSWDAQTKITAQGLLATLMSFQFLVTFICIRAILETVKPLASKLQKRDLDVYKARNLITDRVERVKEMRADVDQEFTIWYADCKRIADELNIQEKTPRTCGRQTKRSNVTVSSPPEYFKLTVAIPFLDHLSNELNDRFQKDDHVAYTLGCLIPEQMMNLSQTEMQKLSSDLLFWNSDLQSSSSNDLLAQLLEWKRACKKLVENGITPDSLLDTYRITDEDIFPDVKTLLHIGCTLPVSSCEAERSFSGFRRIKSYMRSTMNEDRLSALALMHLHHAKYIDAKIICQTFIGQNKRRMFQSSILYD